MVRRYCWGHWAAGCDGHLRGGAIPATEVECRPGKRRLTGLYPTFELVETSVLYQLLKTPDPYKPPYGPPNGGGKLHGSRNNENPLTRPGG